MKGSPTRPAYGASKAAVTQLTAIAANEYGHAGIRVNAVCPGWTESPGLSPDSATTDTGVSSVVPMGRYATTKEQAEAITWLCSASASYITGQTIAVDGGASVRMLAAPSPRL